MYTDSASKRPRIAWIDGAKGIAIILVIFGHTIDYNSPLRGYIFSFHMPLFFILAGYTFRQKRWNSLLTSSFKRLFIPYTMLFLLWRVPNFLAYTDHVNSSSLKALLGSFIFASGTTVQPFGFDAAGMSWFLASLFCSRIILNAICRSCSNGEHPIISSGATSASLLLLGVFLGRNLHLYLPLSLDVSMAATFFMWVGHLMKQVNLTKAILNPFACIISACAWIGAAHFSFLELAARDYRILPLAIIAAIAGTIFTCNISKLICDGPSAPLLNQLRSFLLFSGKNSLTIYSFHSMDWWIPWSSLPSIVGIPFAHGLAASFRIAYNSLYTKLIRTIS